MDRRLSLYHVGTVVKYSKNRRKGKVSIYLPRKYVGFHANIIIYKKSNTGRLK